MLDRYIKQSPMAGNTGLGGGPTGTALGGGAGLTVTLGGNKRPIRHTQAVYKDSEDDVIPQDMLGGSTHLSRLELKK